MPATRWRTVPLTILFILGLLLDVVHGVSDDSKLGNSTIERVSAMVAWMLLC
jgi:hypothetical protein